ncbi:AMP-binding protein [Lichenihabitans sp. Uapishka_5]|uniref:AMP-binding protein n=1 Tax=Lichenihabitans sp. Uapishka_5 TaxID=3037302 RepID=UPI0029E809FA|nr:AMP-binding protein [Lichenihabitans sp. Uapishka_5]MDX7951948.1 AMP-binding protein [Lichenihabitans sp. Uapishka_5]
MLLSADLEPDATASPFRWTVPGRYNIGVAICDRWAARTPERPAIIERDAGGHSRITPFAALRERSNRLAGALRRQDVAKGDRVAVLLPQGAAVVSAHVAIYKLGAVVVPLASVFGVDTLAFRLADAGCTAVVTDGPGAAKLAGLRARLPALNTVMSVDGADAGVLDLPHLMARESPDFDAVDTAAEAPALMIYTSGTTGGPKGALHAHRVLLGHLPGFCLTHDGFPKPDDLMWTPADWAWAGGLLNAVLPSLHCGVPVLARPTERFDPDAVWRLLAEGEVRNAFVPPTALRMLRAVEPHGGTRQCIRLRSITAAGEPLGAETAAWGRDAFGVSVNEVFGQTECNYVLGSWGQGGVSRPGTIGRALPGHTVRVVRPDATPCAPGEVGQIAVAQPDPAMFLGYWNAPEATAAKFAGAWMLTGDQARCDLDGFVSFLGRDDDVITSAGYRIGPAEIEECLLGHPAVSAAAAVGKPDRLRTEIVKAYVVLRPGHDGSPELATDIQRFVRTRLSAHEYPREVAFLEALPMTSSGKVMRRLLRDTP